MAEYIRKRPGDHEHLAIEGLIGGDNTYWSDAVYLVEFNEVQWDPHRSHRPKHCRHRSLPPYPPSPNSAPPPQPLWVAPAPCPGRTNDDAVTFMVDMYHTLISGHITHTPNSNASLILIRRNIIRKQFNAEALRLIHASNASTASLDELDHIIQLASTSCGLILISSTSTTTSEPSYRTPPMKFL